jgi:hypothetical protein
LVIKEIYIAKIREDLNQLSQRVVQDIGYENNLINLDKYNADPLTPLPNQSGLYPLYIFTMDGFVIERSQPIDNFLDTSNYNYWITFKEIKTVETVTSEKWRIISKPIIKDGKQLGVVVVSLHLSANQEPNLEIDDIINTDADNLLKSIEIKNDIIDISKIDIRNTHFLSAFEIVDKYNKVLLNNGRTPAFIDSSYIQKEVNSLQTKTLSDHFGNTYLLNSTLKNDEQGNPILLIVSGQKINNINDLVNKYILTIFPIYILASIVITIIISKIFANTINIKVKDTQKIGAIRFDTVNNTLIVDDKTIEVPYDSNQYYLCKALFSKPNKKWELDELFSFVGETMDDTNSRKYYDTVIAINKKVGIKLFEYKSRIYRINPEYIINIAK